MDQLAQLAHVVGRAHERERDVVDVELEREREVVQVLLGQGRDRQRHAGRFTPLCEMTCRRRARSRARCPPRPRRRAGARARRRSARRGPGWSTSASTAGATGRSPSRRRPRSATTITSLARVTSVRGSREPADAELRALQVGDQRERPAAPASCAARTSARALGVLLVGAVREVEPRRVHAGLDERRRPSPASTTRGRSCRRSSCAAARPRVATARHRSRARQSRGETPPSPG